MNKRGGLEGVTRSFTGHLVRGQAAQFIVNDRQKFVGGLGVTLLDGGENSGDVAHATVARRGPFSPFRPCRTPPTFCSIRRFFPIGPWFRRVAPACAACPRI